MCAWFSIVSTQNIYIYFFSDDDDKSAIISEPS
jgi:hypothetical protein